ncbi:hypothetical protein FGE12_28880 [Aggregicoccus sp. 17bor-14]|uniref:hypothetical protein n=1 Tax=Myxococcaceae TaxID=31 RepID=UPI00129C6471|nr:MULTISPECIES: hypothetical protein [Myxococcaceae]MBF5046463.1 hypothetical protein [Simulacricoccus sp. 17bor-14]MRI92181.1 hypothetical protein [Aggregicoccus sp. 17bor-14]
MAQEIRSERAGERVWATALGRLEVRVLTPAVTLFVERGILDASFCAPLLEQLEATLSRAERPRLFVDAEGLEGYAPEIQQQATEWLHQHRARFGVQHMLVRSRLAQTGVSLASVRVGSAVRGYNVRAPFEEALAAAVRGERER